jgi:hypothetical protein
MFDTAVHTTQVPSAVTTAEPAAVRQRAARGEWWLLDRLALAWSVLTALALYLLIERGGWYADDFLTFGQARQYPLSLRYLERTTLGHPQPGIRLLDWVLYRISPMNYPLAAALMCLVFGFMTWLVYRILRMAFRPSPWHLVLTAMVSTTALWVPAAAWWAAGPEVGGCAAASMLTVYALLRCHRGPRRLLWGALTGGALAIGLSCYERALFGGAFAAWFLPAVTCRSVRPRELLAVLRRAWSGYLALAAVTAGYLLAYLTHQLVRMHAGYTWHQLLHFLWMGWSHALIPGLFGGTLRTRRGIVGSFADPPLWWLAGCQLALLALVGYGLLRNRLRALLAWLVFGILFLVGQYLIARARLALYGLGVGKDFRYVADLLPLLVLTLAISVLRPAATSPEQAGREVLDRRPLGIDRRHLLATGAGLIALCTVFLVTAPPMSYRWTHGRNVRYVQNLRAGIAELDRKGPWSLYTTYAPAEVVHSSAGHYSQTPEVARLVTDRQVSADDPSKPMYVATGEGQLKPASLRPVAMAPDFCSSAPQKVMLELSQPMRAGYWNLQLHYQVSAPTVLQFAVDPGSGPPVEATGNFRKFPVSGSGELTFALRRTAIQALRVELATGAGCVSDLRIGIPQPTR